MADIDLQFKEDILPVTKEVDTKAEEKSVIDRPSWQERGSLHRTLLFVANVADTITPWSITPLRRDKELREFYVSEPYLASTVYAVSARASGFKWEVVPADPTKPKPINTIREVTNILQNSNMGRGWESLILETCADLYCQDNGAFWELVRAVPNTPAAPVIMVNHLDSQRCTRTGDPQYPVIYEDRWGREHVLAWYQVVPLSEFPSADEEAYGVQVCAVSRVLRAAQVLKSIELYKYEKVSGNFARAIHFVSGVTAQEIEDGLAWAREQILNMGTYRYQQPVIIPGIDPTNRISKETIELASLPDAFDEETTFKWYIAQLALGFGVDYQELAPLPGGNLGSSQQSQILHLKTQGKGPALIMALFEHVINNYRIVPRTVKFQFKEHDIRADLDRANAAFIRGKDRVLQVDSGILDMPAALDLAVLAGDIPEYIAQQVQERGIAAPRNRGNAGSEMSGNQITGGTQSQEDRPVASPDDN